MVRKNGIDVFRLIGAFLIMCLHTGYGDLENKYVDQITLFARWAVPFFFITTGYFLGKKIKDEKLEFGKIQSNVLNLISILIVASIIYLPLAVYLNSFTTSVSNLLTGTYFHLWFVGSLLFGYVFIWYIFFIKKNRILPHISFVIISLALIANSYDQFFYVHLKFDFFRFLLSIPFIYLGVILSKKVFTQVNYKLLIGLILVGLTIQTLEADLLYNLFGYDRTLNQFLFGTIIAVVPLFILSSKINLRDNKFSEWGKQHALFIYLYHPMAYFVMGGVMERTLPEYSGSIKMFFSIIGFGLILIFSILLRKFYPKIYSIMNGNL